LGRGGETLVPWSHNFKALPEHPTGVMESSALESFTLENPAMEIPDLENKTDIAKFRALVQTTLNEHPQDAGFLRVYAKSEVPPSPKEDSFRSQKRHALWLAVDQVRKEPSKWQNLTNEAWANFLGLQKSLKDQWERRKFELLKEAKRKRKQKELDYRLRIGTKRFNEQLHRQKAERSHRYGSIIEQGHLPWSEIKQALSFLGSELGKSYFQEWFSGAEVSFSDVPMIKLEDTYTYLSDNPLDLYRFLREMVDHPWTRACAVEITLTFDEENAEEHKHTPVPYTLMKGYEPLSLRNMDRVSSPYVCKILGLAPPLKDPDTATGVKAPRQDHFLVVTDELVVPYRLFPPELESWEELNPKIVNDTYVARRVTTQTLTKIRVQYQGLEFLMKVHGDSKSESGDPYKIMTAFFPVKEEEVSLDVMDLSNDKEPEFKQGLYDAALATLRRQDAYKADEDPFLAMEEVMEQPESITTPPHDEKDADALTTLKEGPGVEVSDDKDSYLEYQCLDEQEELFLYYEREASVEWLAKDQKRSGRNPNCIDDIKALYASYGYYKEPNTKRYDEKCDQLESKFKIKDIKTHAKEVHDEMIRCYSYSSYYDDYGPCLRFMMKFGKCPRLDPEFPLLNGRKEKPMDKYPENTALLMFDCPTGYWNDKCLLRKNMRKMVLATLTDEWNDCSEFYVPADEEVVHLIKKRYGTHQDNSHLEEVFMENEDGTVCLRDPVHWVNIYGEVISNKKNPEHTTMNGSKDENDLSIAQRKKRRKVGKYRSIDE